MRKIVGIIGVALLLGACTTVQENSCNMKPHSVENVQQIFATGKNLERTLNSLNARGNANVIVMGRSGQELDKYNIQYSHAGFIVKEQGKWQVYHLLNECPTDKGGLYKEGLGDFVSGIFDKQPLTFGFAVPAPKVQQALAKMLQDSTARNRVFDANYSAVAHPFNLINQNSNGWLLEFYAQAEASAEGVNIRNREEAQRWLFEKGYVGQSLEASVIKQRLAAMFVGNVSLQGHETKDRYQGRLLINSGDSVLTYVAERSPKKACEQYRGATQNGSFCEFRLQR